MSAFGTDRVVGAEEPALAAPSHDRLAHLGGVDVPWRLVRARRRTIGFVVDGRGLEVRAPRSVSLAEIEAGLAEKARWIARTWQRVAARARDVEAARTVWGDGTCVLWKGRPLVVRLRGALEGENPPRRTEPGLDEGGDPPVLVLDLPADAGPSAIRAATRAWLERAALRAVSERAAVHAATLGVRVTRIGLSDAKTRWGSAGTDGAIRLHWRLVQLAPDLLDAVVAHEVAHLREMNHGPRFWAHMARLVADPAATRRRLREAAATLAPF